MPNFPRTDLAVEAEALRSAAAAAQLPGVRAVQTQRRGFAVTQVEVLDAAGSEALCKPIGRYDTLDLTPLLRRADDAFENAAQTLSELLRAALPLMPEASVLVVGLGNRAITPDAVGPDAMQSVLVTRHLRAQLPEQFGHFRSVAALTPGVLGTTGVESAELVRAMTDRLHPDAVIAVDALACAEPDRLGCTVQLTDTGITPGSGVGNDRAGLDRTTLGVPVAADGHRRGQPHGRPARRADVRHAARYRRSRARRRQTHRLWHRPRAARRSDRGGSRPPAVVSRVSRETFPAALDIVSRETAQKFAAAPASG